MASRATQCELGVSMIVVTHAMDNVRNPQLGMLSEARNMRFNFTSSTGVQYSIRWIVVPSGTKISRVSGARPRPAKLSRRTPPGWRYASNLNIINIDTNLIVARIGRSRPEPPARAT
ncbi:hypothetical protein EVAR_59722_1 [Eumeta japonica]|uniref:Uncharacterized protein n=1 Tax=Eumeta variegata TaxID=151549 RepID=A0A4C1XJ05_EUMVA|nr:hypothetical protein EVAR_59722_1 [Eumeta japonica]